MAPRDPLLGSYSGLFPTPADPVVKPEKEESTFENILTTVGRLGYATRAAIQGNFEGTARNLGQLAADIPTGGFIDKDMNLFSIANIFLPEKYEIAKDITRKQDRPEFTDLMGDASSLGRWEKLLWDVAGGIATDPLSFLGAPTKAVTQGAQLAGATDDAARHAVRQSLQTTNKGQEALAREVDELVGIFANGGDDALAAAARIEMGAQSKGFTDAVSTLRQTYGSGSDFSAALRADPRLADDLSLYASQRLFERGAGETFDDFATLLRNTDHTDRGVARLASDGLAERGGVYFQVPFMPKTRKQLWAPQGGGGLWTQIGKNWTLPGWLAYGLPAPGALGTPLADVGGRLVGAPKSFSAGEALAERFKEFRAWAGGKFFKRALAGSAGVPQQLVNQADEIHGVLNSKQRNAFDRITQTIRSLFPHADGLDPNALAQQVDGVQRDLGLALKSHRDKWTELTNQARVDTGRLTDDVVRQIGDELETSLRIQTEQIARQHGADLGAAQEMVSSYRGDMQSIRRELVDRKIFTEREFNNPFYVMDQLEQSFLDLLDQSVKSKELREEVLKTAKHSHDPEAFAAALEQIRSRHQLGWDEVASPLQETHLGTLWYKRVSAHNQTIARKDLTDAAELMKQGDIVGPGTALDDYLSAQFETVKPRAGLSKFLGGGKYTDPMGSGEWIRKQSNLTEAEFEDWLKQQQRTKDSPWSYTKNAEGKIEAAYNWRGLNYLYKPLLTVVNPSFHVSNTVSSVFMASLDPSIGLKTGAKGLLETVRNLPIIKTFADRGFGKSTVGLIARSLGDDVEDVADALGQLEKLDVKIGRYTPTQVREIASRAIGYNPTVGSLNPADLGQMVEELPRAIAQGVLDEGKSLSVQGAGRLYNRIVETAGAASNYVERSVRTNALVQMLADGMDANQAIQKVNRAFVDYNIVSSTERTLRDVIPFAKFAMASVPWAKNLLQRPAQAGGLLQLGRAQGSLNEGDLEYLPPVARTTLALALPGLDKDGHQRVITGLRLPQETTLKMLASLDLLMTPVTGEAPNFRQQILGGIAPPLRFGLEAAVGKSFFFGEETGKFRKAPAYLTAIPGMTEEITLPDGTKRYEISGHANEVINAMPFSRLSATASQLFDGNKPAWQRAIKATTGFKITSVNQERELKSRIAQLLKEKAKRGEVQDTLQYFARPGTEVPEDIKVLLTSLRTLKERTKEKTPREFGRYRF